MLRDLHSSLSTEEKFMIWSKSTPPSSGDRPHTKPVYSHPASLGSFAHVVSTLATSQIIWKENTRGGGANQASGDFFGKFRFYFLVRFTEKVQNKAVV